MKKISLTQKKFAVIDDDMFDVLSKHKWCVNNGYAVRGIVPGGRIQEKMHRIIMNAPKNLEVDHIDGDRLNNQRSNLRLCIHSRNVMNCGIYKNNTSGYKGVSWNKQIEKWIAHIRINKKRIHLGVFVDKKKAVEIYNKNAEKYFEKFARLNKII